MVHYFRPGPYRTLFPIYSALLLTRELGTWHLAKRSTLHYKDIGVAFGMQSMSFMSTFTDHLTCLECNYEAPYSLCSALLWHPILYIVHYYGPWSKVVHYNSEAPPLFNSDHVVVYRVNIFTRGCDVSCY